MSILVHDSNKAACRAAAAALQQGCRAALVRPAGTGKGRIVWEMLAEQPDTRVLWVASCAARLELRRGLAKELGKTLDGSVRLMDCEQLAAQSALGWVALAEFRPGLLVLDGWREMSARDWTDCVQLLFRLCPEAKVLALAEPDAPGESCRAARRAAGRCCGGAADAGRGIGRWVAAHADLLHGAALAAGGRNGPSPRRGEEPPRARHAPTPTPKDIRL